MRTQTPKVEIPYDNVIDSYLDPNRLDEALEKCFKITGALQGGGYTSLAGNFDSQGISFGILQWCLGQGSLQPVLLKMYEVNPDAFRMACSVWVPLYKKAIDLTDHLIEACKMPADEGVMWASKKQDKMFRLYPHWEVAFTRLGADKEFQAVQRFRANSVSARAIAYCEEFDLRTEKALALFFDGCAQQGGLKPPTKARILENGFAKANYQGKLDILAEAMSKQAKDIHQREILARRMCIARGGGNYNGNSYHFKQDFGLTDEIIL